MAPWPIFLLAKYKADKRDNQTQKCLKSNIEAVYGKLQFFESSAKFSASIQLEQKRFLQLFYFYSKIKKGVIARIFLQEREIFRSIISLLQY